ncbi:UvrD-helicase domain-containing protein [Gephyromycinifex aptenodytis]|uniref:UvrD-helicase domain-containing protein n=1 Tax=Gephyromycinifex aptenodytis TaxID=2716227 RepID=UPI0014459391|nr:ATP-dependent helicase [Gephyromycinifex aptenodytis]
MKVEALSGEHSAAAKAKARHAMIIAPPGCGKTEVLAHRADHLIQFLGPNQRILALTFTNRAKTNLHERLRNVLGYARMRRYVTVRNFHGHATEVVLAHGRTIGLDPGGLLLPTTSRLRKALEATGTNVERRRAAEDLLDEVKRAPLSDDEVIDALTKKRDCVGADLALRVEKERQTAKQLHYQDLLRHAQRLLRIPAVGHLYRCHFGAVLVDEFQDLSLQQLDLVRLSCTARQTYAGDPMQGIFSWAGAAPEQVEREVRDSCAEPIMLRESYRASPGVLATVNSVSRSLASTTQLISARPERWPMGGCSAALVVQDRAAEARLVVGLTQQIIERDPTASVGVISRAGWRREDIDRAFTSLPDIPVRRWDLALEDPRVVALIREMVASLPRGATLDVAREAVLDAVDPSDVDTLEQVNDAFAALEQGRSSTAREALSSIRVSDPNQAVGPGVHLLNAHAGKGQEFDWVFVIGLEEGHMPHKKSSHGEALIEEHRVLLVMLSRARHGLVVSRAQMNYGRYGTYAATQSRWWDTIESECTTLAEVEAHIGALPPKGST